MFRTFGNVAARRGLLLIAGWILALFVLKGVAPQWEDVIRDGEFRYLPDDVQSRRAEELFRSAFSKDLLGSMVVIVVRREAGEGLTQDDRTFIDEVLAPRLESIAQEEGGLADADAESTSQTLAELNDQPVISHIRTFRDKALGKFLDSEDNKASLVMVELTTEFMERRNWATIARIEQLTGEDGELSSEGLIPIGLELTLSGSATVGRDMKRAAGHSASATETWTILLVVILLVAIYRAPILAFIPLATVYIAVSISLKLLAIAADAEIFGLFHGIEVYVTIVLYGAGVDYCMFLMARYKEELDSGSSYDEAISNAVNHVGSALAASAGTTMCGIGMMAFAEFGKFRQAGLAMSASLIFVLLAALTFAPAMLRLAGRWAFWPEVRTEQSRSASGWISPTSLVARLIERDWFGGVWEWIGKLLLARPATVWLACVAIMTPFAVWGVMNFGSLSYGLLSELPQDEPSVIGAKAVQQHFPAGETGPVTVLVQNRNIDFRDRASGRSVVRELTDNLYARRDELGIAYVRSVSHPLGHKIFDKLSIPQRAGFLRGAPDVYVSNKGELEGHVTRLDVVFDADPFSRYSMRQFDKLKVAIREELPDALRGGVGGEGTSLAFVGPTASIRDLKSVTGRDQISVDVLVVISVFMILVILLRRPAISAYLIISVVFSYLVTLGFTFAVFQMLDPAGFSGLDWKVPMFLFTILIAVGQDYNIYLITRVEEESLTHGPVNGITVALQRTGSIISSCGLIMAGTFSSLMAGSLVGMNQLGFALACGVLLDTFVVRPVLVPAYLVLLHSGRFGAVGRLLGAQEYFPPQMTPSLKIGSNPRDDEE